MPRPKRVVIENSWHHVFNRGIGRKTVCFSEYHFEIFKTLIGELFEKYEIQTHAYCMLKNHYHLLLFTPKANLSKGMWYFGRKFATIVNQDINSDGPVFRSRFKSIHIEDDRYLLQVHRYIHLNPVEAGIVTQPEESKWSSCKMFLDPEETGILGLNRDLITHYFKNESEYRDFLNVGNHAKLSEFYKRTRIPGKINQETI